MSESKHTPGPWYVSGQTILQDSERYSQIATLLRMTFKAKPNGEYHPCEEMEANAARIVACVNACEGIDDPAQFVQNMRSDNRDLLHRLGNAEVENEALRAEIEALKAFNESKLMEHPNFSASDVWKKDPES